MLSGAFPKPATAAAGQLAVFLISLVRRMPARVTRQLLWPALKVYPLLRPGHVSRLKARFAACPFPSLTPGTYYAARLDLMIRGLKLHGSPIPPILEDGTAHYREALIANRPIALIGLHAGLLELQHRVPEAPKARPFYILTAPAFSPPLTAFMAQGRERDGKRILWIGKGGKGYGQGPGGVEALGKNLGKSLGNGLRALLGSNGVLALMADQHPGPAEACEYLHLWGAIRVPWPARLLRFLDSKGVICLPVSTRIDYDGNVRFTYHPPLRPDAESIRAYLETSIAQSPEQWNWSYPKITPSVSPSGKSHRISDSPPAAGPRHRRVS
ncbi:MAG: hypothetical protein ABIW76_02620 [Fibrobacteria bacterium]